MTLNRAQLLRRALVGGAIVVFGDFKETTDAIARLAPAPEVPVVRTAIPTAARFTPWAAPSFQILDEKVHWTRDELEALPPELYAEMGRRDWVKARPQGAEATSPYPYLAVLTAQKVEWLEPVKGYAPESRIEEVAALLPPQAARHFKADDVLRNAHSGDLYLVREDRPEADVLHLSYIGFSNTDQPLVDARAELEALRGNIVPARPDAEDTVIQGERPVFQAMEWRAGDSTSRMTDRTVIAHDPFPDIR